MVIIFFNLSSYFAKFQYKSSSSLDGMNKTQYIYYKSQ